MADVVSVHTVTGQVHNGPGMVYGIVLTSSLGTTSCIIDDSLAGGGTKLFQANAALGMPVVIFLSDRLAPRFKTGCYITLGANAVVTLWTRKL